jgi:hypothetical protein
MKVQLVKREDRWDLYETRGHKIASVLDGCAYKLSLKNCQEIERGYDLDALASEYAKKREDLDLVYANGLYYGFLEGFQKALEFMGDKIFTLDDIHTIFIMGREGMEDKMNRYVTRIHEPTEWDVEILEECLDKNCDGINKKGECITTGIPKLDDEGCLILKKI